ncbi:hypothetical protein KKG72_04750 [bacterium]|nr:hypothetical protein [bacterium]
MSQEDKKTPKIDLPRDFVIPTNLALSSEIYADYKFLYAYISYRCSTRGYMWFENKTLATHLNKDINFIKRGLIALAEAKWIHIDNWVKKGSLYHGSFRRVIWVYSDYLVALDKGGYGAVRPLPFNTWKQRFTNALLDASAISLVLYFFPTMEYMGSLGISINPEDMYLFKYIKTEKEGYKIQNMNKAQADVAYKKLYDFYAAQHKKPNKKLTQEKYIKTIERFDEFQKFIREEFIDKTVVVRDDIKYTVNGLGLMMRINEDDQPITMDGDNAIELWQWMFANQDQIIR